jgi:hypothetical protein
VSGGYFVLGRCWACKRPFMFNPTLVPSLQIDPETNLPLDVDEHGHTREIDPAAAARAVKQPICETCVERVNDVLAAKGREPIRVLAGAYEWTEGLPP